MTTMGARIDAVSRELLAAARSRARDAAEAHWMAHNDFMRILRGDPSLDRYVEIINALRRDEARAA